MVTIITSEGDDGDRNSSVLSLVEESNIVLVSLCDDIKLRSFVLKNFTFFSADFYINITVVTL